MQVNGASSAIPSSIALNPQQSGQSSARPEAAEAAAVEAAEGQSTQAAEGEVSPKPTTSRLDIFV